MREDGALGKANVYRSLGPHMLGLAASHSVGFALSLILSARLAVEELCKD